MLWTDMKKMKRRQTVNGNKNLEALYRRLSELEDEQWQVEKEICSLLNKIELLEEREN